MSEECCPPFMATRGSMLVSLPSTKLLCIHGLNYRLLCSLHFGLVGVYAETGIPPHRDFFSKDGNPCCSI